MIGIQMIGLLFSAMGLFLFLGTFGKHRTLRGMMGAPVTWVWILLLVLGTIFLILPL